MSGEAPAATAERHIRCGTCRRRFPCPPADLLRHAREGWPRCCGEVMALDPAPGADVRRDNRVGRRRPAKAGCAAEVRVGVLGLGPDLGAGLVDVSEDGACVRVKAALPAGAQVEARLSGPGCRKPVAAFGTVCWCRPDGRWFLARLRLRRRLTYTELADLSRPV